MYPAIRRYDDQAFNDMTVESDKKNKQFYHYKKPLRPVPNQSIFNGNAFKQSMKSERHQKGQKGGKPMEFSQFTLQQSCRSQCC